jgi:RNA polymerase sigma-70 factor (ECF subfamily)
VDETAREKLEARVRELCANADFAGAATAVVQAYGAELFGFLAATHRDAVDAADAFSETSEGIWRGLPTFGWESSVRTWAYAIARNVSRTRRRNAARRGRHVMNGGDELFEGVVQKVRTETSAFLRTETKTRLQALRDSLPEEDQTLLVLRVNRSLSWNDLARILTETEGQAPLDDTTLVREAARLRKRFQLVKDRLRELAKREGLTE